MRSLVRWVKAHALSLTVAVLVAAFAFGQFQTYDVVDKVRENRIADEVRQCEGSREFRHAFPNTLRDIGRSVAEASSAGGSVDLTALPEFDRLDDASVQAYLAALSARLSAGGGDGGRAILDHAADEFSLKFPAPDCVALERRLRHELR